MVEFDLVEKKSKCKDCGNWFAWSKHQAAKVEREPDFAEKIDTCGSCWSKHLKERKKGNANSLSETNAKASGKPAVEGKVETDSGGVKQLNAPGAPKPELVWVKENLVAACKINDEVKEIVGRSVSAADAKVAAILGAIYAHRMRDANFKSGLERKPVEASYHPKIKASSSALGSDKRLLDAGARTD